MDDAIALLDSLYESGDLSVDQHAGITRGFLSLQAELRAALDVAMTERDRWRALAQQAQADALALRAAIWSAHFDIHYRHNDHWTWEECPKPTCYPLREALAAEHPGAALLAELRTMATGGQS